MYLPSERLLQAKAAVDALKPLLAKLPGISAYKAMIILRVWGLFQQLQGHPYPWDARGLLIDYESPANDQLFKDLRYYWVMAMSIYPGEVLKSYFGEHITASDDLLTVHFPYIRILMRNFDGGLLPWHALCEDPVHRRLVVVVRGSVDVSDWLINVSVSVTDRETHGGYWNCCRLMLQVLRPLIDDFMTLHPEYELHVTGHSLGAGLASMLAISLKPHYPHVKGWAYACPRCIGRELAENSIDYITSVVYGRDCVPRLSVHTVYHIADVFKETSDMDDLELLGLDNVTRIIPLSSNPRSVEPVPSAQPIEEEKSFSQQRYSLVLEPRIASPCHGPKRSRSADDPSRSDVMLPEVIDELHSKDHTESEQVLGDDECTEDSGEEIHQNVFDVLSLKELEKRLSRRAEICKRIFLLAPNDVMQDILSGIRRYYVDTRQPKKKSLSFAESRRSVYWDGFKSLVPADAENFGPDKFTVKASHIDKEEQATISGEDSPTAEDGREIHAELCKAHVCQPGTHLEEKLQDRISHTEVDQWPVLGEIDRERPKSTEIRLPHTELTRPRLSLQSKHPVGFDEPPRQQQSGELSWQEFHSVRSHGCTPRGWSQSAPFHRSGRPFSQQPSLEQASLGAVFTPRSSLGTLSDGPAPEAVERHDIQGTASGGDVEQEGCEGDGAEQKQRNKLMEYVLTRVSFDSESEADTPAKFSWSSWLTDAFNGKENSPPSCNGPSSQPENRLSPSSYDPSANMDFLFSTFRRTTTGYLRMLGIHDDLEDENEEPSSAAPSWFKASPFRTSRAESPTSTDGNEDQEETNLPSFGLSTLIKNITDNVLGFYFGDEDPEVQIQKAMDDFFKEFRSALITPKGEPWGLSEDERTASKLSIEALQQMMVKYQQLLMLKIQAIEHGRDTSLSLEDRKAGAFLYSRFSGMSEPETDQLYIPGRIIQIIPIEHFVGSDPQWSGGLTATTQNPSSKSTYKTSMTVHPVAQDCPPDESIKKQIWCLLSHLEGALPSQVFIDATGCRLDWFQPIFVPSSVDDHSPASYSKGLVPGA